MFGTDDNYSYLINGEAMSELQAFIDNEESTYEEYIEVCISSSNLAVYVCCFWAALVQWLLVALPPVPVTKRYMCSVLITHFIHFAHLSHMLFPYRMHLLPLHSLYISVHRQVHVVCYNLTLSSKVSLLRKRVMSSYALWQTCDGRILWWTLHFWN